METQIKDYQQTKSGFKVVQHGDVIQSYNKMGQVFHFIDTSYLREGIYYHGWIGYRSNEQIIEVLCEKIGYYNKRYRPPTYHQVQKPLLETNMKRS
jgi:hypothetical protein